MANLDNLRVRQDAMTLAKNVYLFVKDVKDFSFKDQIQRSAISIPSNIAE
jgi:four helix bundle protein